MSGGTLHCTEERGEMPDEIKRITSTRKRRPKIIIATRKKI
jgi:hypothetical protein